MNTTAIIICVLGIICIVLQAVDGGCNHGSTPSSKNDNLDTNSGSQYIMTSSTYTLSCCGLLSTIMFYPKATGFIEFQAWRPLVTNTYQLIGEYRYFVPTKDEERTVIVSDEINVQIGDKIGWYCNETDIIPYNIGGGEASDNIILANHTDYSVNQNHSVTSPYVHQRSYAIKYFIEDDSSPYFTNLPHTVEVYDHVTSGEFLYTIEYTDPETGNIPYLSLTQNSLSPSSSNIALDTASGNVTTTGSISKGTITLEAKVTDPCGNTATKKLTINVLNHAPEIHNLPSSVDLDESTSVETQLFIISVTDQSGDAVTCNLKSTSPSSTQFVVKTISRTSTYAVFSRANPNFRYDTRQSYELTIECTDDKDPVSKILTVYLIRNDPPTITNLPKAVTLSTETATGTIIYTVMGTDPENDSLTFSIHCSNLCPFTVADTGQVIIDEFMDELTTQHWDVSLRVSDGISTSAYFVLSVLFSGVNNMPTIDNLPWTLSIPETTPIGTVIYTLSVTERDAGDVLHYTFGYNPTDAGVKFSFDKTTLEVKVSDTLDYESGVTQYVISFTVDDTHLSDGPHDLTITVLETNESPAFSKSKYYITEDEGSINQQLVSAGFTVSDPDSSDALTYSLVPNSYSHYFTIAPSDGNLSYAVNYDVDESSFPSDVCLTVQIKDTGGLTATSLVMITVNDLDDNVPIFSRSAYEFAVSNTAAILTTLGQVSANDKDSGKNAEIIYSIIENTDSFNFGIKVVSGSLYVYRSLAALPDYQTFSFQVRAQSVLQINSSSHRDTANVKITVTPVTYTSYFDDASNVAWVTIVVIVGTIVLAVAAMICYRNRRSIKNRFICCESSPESDSHVNERNLNTRNVALSNPVSRAIPNTRTSAVTNNNVAALPVIEEKCGLPWDDDYVGYEKRNKKVPTPPPSVVKVQPKESDNISVASSAQTDSKLLWSNYNNWVNRPKTS